jgi:hypothetical protein
MNLCDSLSWEVGLHSSTAVRGGRSRAPRVGRGAPIRMIRKRRCAAVGQGQMIVVQYPEGFKASSTARGGSCTHR